MNGLNVSTRIGSVPSLDSLQLQYVSIATRNNKQHLETKISKNVFTSNPTLDAGIIKKQQYLRKLLHSIGTFILDSQGNVLENLIAMDSARRYPITSACGHKYIMVMYDFDSNQISEIK
jgi:hypothetical protein